MIHPDLNFKQIEPLGIVLQSTGNQTIGANVRYTYI